MKDAKAFDIQAEEEQFRTKLVQAVKIEANNALKLGTLVTSLLNTATENAAVISNTDIDALPAGELREMLVSLQSLRENFPITAMQQYFEGVQMDMPACGCCECAPAVEVATEQAKGTVAAETDAPAGIKVVIVGRNEIPADIRAALTSGVLSAVLHSGGALPH